MKAKQPLTSVQAEALIGLLKTRFQKNLHRHANIEWADVEAKLHSEPIKLRSLHQMEETGGEPDCIGYIKKTNTYIFADCSAESPAGRRSLCYDAAALAARKENKPRGSALEMANEMGIEILSEAAYRNLQTLEPFDHKTSSWLATPEEIRKLGGAIFGDFRYNHVFIYHNGVQSYYAARGFRGVLHI
jgi:hypothetical protein